MTSIKHIKSSISRCQACQLQIILGFDDDVKRISFVDVTDCRYVNINHIIALFKHHTHRFIQSNYL